MTARGKPKATRIPAPSLAWWPKGRRMTKAVYNRLLVCASLFHEGPASRVGLYQRTGLPISRLSEICGALLRDGLIRESLVAPPGGNGRGRPQTLLELDLRGLAVACVQYDQDHINAAVTDLGGTLRWQRRWDGPFEEDAQRRLRRIARAVTLAFAVLPSQRMP